MHKIKNKLMEELCEVEEKMKKSSGKLSAGDLEYIHKLTDSIKNIDKIEMLEEQGGQSEASNWMGEGRMYGTSYARGRYNRRDSMGRFSHEGGSYARGGNRGGNRGGGNRGGGNSNRGSSYGDGYSMDDGIDYMMECAEELMECAETPEQKQAVHRFMKELERM